MIMQGRVLLPRNSPDDQTVIAARTDDQVVAVSVNGGSIVS